MQCCECNGENELLIKVRRKGWEGEICPICLMNLMGEDLLDSARAGEKKPSVEMGFHRENLDVAPVSDPLRQGARGRYRPSKYHIDFDEFFDYGRTSPPDSSARVSYPDEYFKVGTEIPETAGLGCSLFSGKPVKLESVDDLMKRRLEELPKILRREYENCVADIEKRDKDLKAKPALALSDPREIGRAEELAKQVVSGEIVAKPKLETAEEILERMMSGKLYGLPASNKIYVLPDCYMPEARRQAKEGEDK